MVKISYTYKKHVFRASQREKKQSRILLFHSEIAQHELQTL